MSVLNFKLSNYLKLKKKLKKTTVNNLVTLNKNLANRLLATSQN